MSPPAPTRLGVRRGEWNHCAGFIGISGAGKSVTEAWWIEERRRESGCYVLLHDAEYAYPSKLPDGRRLDIERHGSISSAERALADPARALRIHAIAVGDAAPVVALANRVGVASAEAARGGIARPSLAVVEEVTNCREMKSGDKLGQTLQEALTLRRHRHCGIAWTTQSPSLVHQHFLSKSTELYIFRLESPEDVRHVVRYGGFPQESAAEIQKLPKFHYLLKKPRGFDDGE